MHVCKKCGHEETLFKDEVDKDFRRCKIREAKDKAMGLPPMADFEFILYDAKTSYTIYKGRAGFYMSQIYKQFQ